MYSMRVRASQSDRGNQAVKTAAHECAGVLLSLILWRTPQSARRRRAAKSLSERQNLFARIIMATRRVTVAKCADKRPVHEGNGLLRCDIPADDEHPHRLRVRGRFAVEHVFGAIMASMAQKPMAQLVRDGRTWLRP